MDLLIFGESSFLSGFDRICGNFFLFVFISPGEETGQQSSGNGMPYTGYGTDDCCLRGRRKLCGSGRQVCGKAGILHTYLNGNRFSLGIVHSGDRTGQISKEISESVVQKNGQENDDSGTEEVGSLRGNNAADNAGKTKDCDSRHDFLELHKGRFFS